MLLVPNKSVPIVHLPELTHSPEHDVGFTRREALPRADDCSKGMSWSDTEQHVDVVGHDGPRMQAIALGVENQKGLLHKSGHSIIPQPTGTPTFVENFIAQTFRLRRMAQPQGRLPGQAVCEAEGDKLNDILGIEMRGRYPRECQPLWSMPRR